MNSHFNWEQGCSRLGSPMADLWNLLGAANCDCSSKGCHDESAKAQDCNGANALQMPHLEILHALNLVAQGVDVSYTPRFARRRTEWETFDRDIALLLPKHNLGQNSDSGLRAELLLAEPAFLEPAAQRHWRRPEPSEFNKQREAVSRPLRLREYPALGTPTERRDRGGFRRLASIGAIALAVVFSLGCYHAVYVTASTNDAPATAAISALLPRLTMALSNLLPAVFDEYSQDFVGNHGSQHVTIADLIGETSQLVVPADGHLVITGLPSGSRVTWGTVNGDFAWRVPMRYVAKAAIVPSHNFVDGIDLSISLHASDGALMNTKVVRLRWSQPPDMVVSKSVRTTVISAPAGSLAPAAEAP